MEVKEIPISTIRTNNFNLSVRHYISEYHAEREYWTDKTYRAKVRRHMKKCGYSKLCTVRETREGNCKVTLEYWTDEHNQCIKFARIGKNTYSIALYKHWGQKVENAGRFVRFVTDKEDLEKMIKALEFPEIGRNMYYDD